MKKKEIIHQIYLSLYLANLLFFSFSSLICCLSQSLIFFQTLQKKSHFLVAPLSTLRNFCTVVLCLQYFVSFLKKTKREIIYLEHCLFLASHLFVSPQPHISSQKKIWKYSIAKYIRENHLL